MDMKRLLKTQRARWITLVLVLLGVFLAAMALGQNAAPVQDTAVQVPSVSLDFGSEDGDDLSSSLKILALLTILSLAPAILILTTAFTRIVIVLSFVRTALGTQTIPPNQVIVGLSLFLTFFVMAPTWNEINETAIQPSMGENPIPFEQALDNAKEPLREFMLRNTYEKDLELFLSVRGEQPQTRDEISMLSLIPAFVISELKTAFVIGFYIFVPFVIIDLIVASVLMGMGMMMMPPVVVSLPAKILVFVLADGWSVLAQALLTGFS